VSKSFTCLLPIKQLTMRVLVRAQRHEFASCPFTTSRRFVVHCMFKVVRMLFHCFPFYSAKTTEFSTAPFISICNHARTKWTLAVRRLHTREDALKGWLASLLVEFFPQGGFAVLIRITSLVSFSPQASCFSTCFCGRILSGRRCLSTCYIQ